MIDDNLVGAFIKAVRQDMELTQDQFARANHITQSFLSRIEHGKADPPAHLIFTCLSEALFKLGQKHDLFGTMAEFIVMKSQPKS